jgi:hypothetical protein
MYQPLFIFTVISVLSNSFENAVNSTIPHRMTFNKFDAFKLVVILDNCFFQKNLPINVEHSDKRYKGDAVFLHGLDRRNQLVVRS